MNDDSLVFTCSSTGSSSTLSCVDILFLRTEAMVLATLVYSLVDKPMVFFRGPGRDLGVYGSMGACRDILNAEIDVKE